MKTLTTLEIEEPQQPWMTAGEHYLVEVECVLSGRAAVQNAVMRNGEGYMRQIATLPLTIPVMRQDMTVEEVCDLGRRDLTRTLIQFVITIVVFWIVAGVVLALLAAVKGAGID